MILKQSKEKLTNLKPWVLIVGVLIIFFAGYIVGNGNNLKFGKSNTSDLPAKLDYSEIDEVYQVLRENFDGELTLDDIMNGLKKGLAGATGDPFTEYLSPEDAKQFEADLNGSFSGIGAELSVEEELIVVVAPLSGFPAEEAGVRAGDIILEVDSESTFGKSLSEVISTIRGPVNTDVTLTIGRVGEQQREITITRADITIESVKTEVIDGIGVIKVSRFANDTSTLARNAAIDLKKQGVKGIVLDLRSNPGGYLEASVDLSGLWLDKGSVVVEEKNGDKIIRSHKATTDPVLKGMPTIVLIDGGSASASEIVAGALKDNGVATLLGVKSFGKGSVQTPQPIRSGGILKVTTAHWYTPKGINIDKEGIEPDEVVEFDIDAFQKNRKNDNQLQTAIQKLSK
ncbi:MAG: S41 family peptidase [bacterium]|nr:S41 family peptidase [bacterium]